MIISEFQQALIGAGAALVAGVWAYNRWQEHRYRKAAEKIFSGTQDDALIEVGTDSADSMVPVITRNAEPFNDERVEPRIEGLAELPDEESAVMVADEMSADADPVESAANQALAVDAPSEECLDALVELGIALPRARDVAALYTAWLEQRIEFHKRIRWVARTGKDGGWADIADPSASNDKDAYVSIQLADRQGAINKTELSAFCTVAEAVAVAQGGQLSIPALDEIMAHANTLDEICASVDIQIAIHIVGRAGQAFAGSKLRGLLEAAGLKLALDGLFYMLDADGQRLLSVCNSGAVPFDLEQMRTGTTSDVTLWLDVPRVADGGGVFDTMLATARQLADALDGVLVDDQRNPLADNVLMGIRAKVLELQSQMAAHGIPAGGRRALRLFA